MTTPDLYRYQVTHAAAAVRHLGDAVRGSRAFFIYRDLRDASQPSIIACHPPLTDAAMLRCLGNSQVVWESVSDTEGHSTLIGVATDSEFRNRELLTELTCLAAQSLASAAPALVPETSPQPAVPNRAAFIEQLEAALNELPKGQGSQLAAVVVDVDHFHRVTARFGDAGGEELLRILARRLIGSLPPEALIASLGGDRFGVLIPGSGDQAEERAVAVAAEIHRAFSEPARLTDEEIIITASIGIGLASAGVGPSKLLRDVDRAIGMAKRAGGAATRVFRERMNDAAAFQLLRERDVRRAVTRGEFIPFFQPIVDAVSAELRGFEALLRWGNPEEGMLPPTTFIDVLEETGLIEVIGRRVIRQSCEQAARWLALTGTLVPVSVNIAPVQLAAPDFCDHVARCLAESGLPAEGLILELTENALVTDQPGTRATLKRLSDLGVRARIDDFGTGYSSLASLHDLPVSGIKLDKRWFTRFEDSSEQRDIVRAIVALAHHMEMDVVAEGIETMQQLQKAREHGCDYAQGFGFAHPLCAEDALQYASSHTAPRQLRESA